VHRIATDARTAPVACRLRAALRQFSSSKSSESAKAGMNGVLPRRAIRFAEPAKTLRNMSQQMNGSSKAAWELAESRAGGTRCKLRRMQLAFPLQGEQVA
jgi:hypothetical protein